MSNALPSSLELANPLIMVLSKIDSGVPHWCTPGTVHEKKCERVDPKPERLLRRKEGCFRRSFAVCLWTLGSLTSQRAKCAALIS